MVGVGSLLRQTLEHGRLPSMTTWYTSHTHLTEAEHRLAAAWHDCAWWDARLLTEAAEAGQPAELGALAEARDRLKQPRPAGTEAECWARYSEAETALRAALDSHRRVLLAR